MGEVASTVCTIHEEVLNLVLWVHTMRHNMVDMKGKQGIGPGEGHLRFHCLQTAEPEQAPNPRNLFAHLQNERTYLSQENGITKIKS